MKKTSLPPALVLLLLILFFSSCGKSNDPQRGNSFTWTYAGVNYTANHDTAYLYTMSVGPIIIAGTGTGIGSPGFGISVNSFSVGTYSFGTGSSNVFRYVDDTGDALYGNIVTLNITANSNSLLSGNFAGNITDATNTSIPITGSFVNLVIKP